MPLGVPSWRATRDTVRQVEAMRFDAVWLADHPLTGFDAWTMLAGLAEATTTIRLGTLVSCVAYRNPVVLARAAADVDRISGGRAVLGLGTGDMPWEFAQLGLAYRSARERSALLEETLQIIKPLLAGEAVDHDGPLLKVKGAQLRSLPSQASGLPILVAGGGERTTLRLVAEHADACNVAAASWGGGAFTVDAATQKLEVLRRHCAHAGRPYDSVLRTSVVGFVLADTVSAAREKLELIPPGTRKFLEDTMVACTPNEAIGRIRGLLSAGFQYLMFAAWPGDMATLELLANRVLPELA